LEKSTRDQVSHPYRTTGKIVLFTEEVMKSTGLCLPPAFTLVSYPEDGDVIFLRNVGRLSRDYTALYLS
jgi:hypothetical protein